MSDEDDDELELLEFLLGKEPDPQDDWVDVASSWCSRVRWDGSRLLVEFHDGVVCAYNVGREVYEGLLAAPSKGKYVREKLKGVPYEKL